MKLKKKNIIKKKTRGKRANPDHETMITSYKENKKIMKRNSQLTQCWGLNWKKSIKKIQINLG